MTTAPPVSVRELIRRLRLLDFDGPFPSGKDSYMRKGSARLMVPDLHAADLSVGLVAKIVRDAGISREDWEKTDR